ncbi:glycosyltransferase family 4 protein [Metabacillus idriensis]|uniref:Glycosyltransferase n=1 Tax=Metabacillus idriensis TaxID=324768 RepID=A0A6I2M9K9_9BACI|nr:glycosyltransferase family 4 protein [Metabacillus idriensis]MCM3598333.1 glycosyltransferase family 4 protein [Metabacillus idriensis]MRX55045.1 glycosyltransferase [Metabacillus idriensis]OHR71607.1 hypothetical protein HMPREF3291_23960 [Bacillus sp. HMSC76G11]
MKSKSKDILLVAPFTILPGEKGFNRFTYIAEQLSQKGHQITLVTSSFQHNDKEFRNLNDIEQLQKKITYKVVLIEELGYMKNIGIDRIKSHRHFANQLSKYLKTLKNKPDMIYCAYPMMETAYIVGKYSKGNKIPLFMDIQDVWPESIKNALPLPEKIVDVLLYPLTIYANSIYKMADYVVAVSKSYIYRVQRVNHHAKSYLPVFIGTDLGYFDMNKQEGVRKVEGEFWITYIGTLSYSYDLETVIRAVAALKKRGMHQIVFKVIGSGPLKNKFVDLAIELDAPVDFMGHLTYEDMIPYLSHSDIAANAITKGAQQSITNKIGDFLAAGLPILNSSLNEEFSQIITEKNIGYNYLPGDYNHLADLIIDLQKNENKRIELGKNARNLAEDQFDRRYTYNDIYQLIEQC